MIEFIANYAVLITCLWLVPLLPSMYILAINCRVIYVKDLIFALLFGPLYFLIQVGSLDTILWKAKENR